MDMLISFFNDNYINNPKIGVYENEIESMDELLQYYNLQLISMFDFETKIYTASHKNINFIKVRYQDMNNWANLLESAIGIHVEIKEMPKSKEHLDFCERFKSEYKLPKFFLNAVKNNIRFKTYNSKIEQIKYIKEWSLKSV
jgi:hypothetical protein